MKFIFRDCSSEVRVCHGWKLVCTLGKGPEVAGSSPVSLANKSNVDVGSHEYLLYTVKISVGQRNRAIVVVLFGFESPLWVGIPA